MNLEGSDYLNVIDLDFIKKTRQERNLSSQEMAEQLGFKDGSTYWNYENGKYRLKADMLPKLAEILNCEIENFFKNWFAEITN